MQLPSSCEGCPFYKYKDHPENGFVPDVVVPGSQVYILAQNPGKDEIQGHKLIKRYYVGRGAHFDEFEQVLPQPLIGATGQEFNTRFLPLSGLQRSEVSLGNAIRCRPGAAMHHAGDYNLDRADSLPNLTATMKLDTSKADIVKALRHCRETHMQIAPSVRVVMTMGTYAMFIMTGLARDEDEYHHRQGTLESWRGYGVALPNFDRLHTVDTSRYHRLGTEDTQSVVFITLHIAALYYGNNRRFVHAVLQDFHKLGRLLRGEWPVENMPAWSSIPPLQWPGYAAFDTEYIPQENNKLKRWSLCSSTKELYCIEAANSTHIPIKEHSTVLIQNALADIHHLKTLVDFTKIKVEDLMLAHSVLWPGEPHSLNYINSIYGEMNRYKHLSEKDEQFYSAADSWEPMREWMTYFIPEFKRDRQSWRVYKQYRLPLIDIIDKAQQTGVKLDSARLRDLQLILQEHLLMYQKSAQELTGDNTFNLGGSKVLKAALYDN